MNVFFPVSASGCLLNSSQPQGCSGYSSAPFFDTGKNPVHCSFRGRSLAAAPGRIAKKTGRTAVPVQGRGFRPVHKPLERLAARLSRSKKEVFQPHLPVRLPCYDLAPVTCFALGRSFRARTSGAPGFHGLTGGVYKARERIHRAMADARLLANPASRSRVADSDPN